MKKTLLIGLLALTSSINAQALLSENFNSLTLGNVTTNTTGATAGQAGFYLDSSNGATPTTSTNATAAIAQIVTGGSSSNGLQLSGPNGDKGGSFLWKNGLTTLWAARTSGNNIIEVETNFENRIEKILFVLQDGVFIVSNQGLDATSENKGTGVYVYAKRVREITSNISLDEVTKQYEQKKSELELENQKLTGNETEDKVVNSKIFVLKDETEFLKKVFLVVKDLKS
jgi:hypothetical protein